ncbi:MAG TPA: Stk1 family PASTA domain-containing Ser/Thr kinase [Mycobacteriales bacterium]|nr:Stk1 family PASTA domain-containing Ser/Thr kinase [Mycobacteriales bacterium]
MDATLSDPMVGRLLEGRYAVEAFIAHGGMASVYLATDTRLDRRVAVKVLHAHLSDDAETLARFEREARSAARLSSPDVVAVYDQGTDNGRAYLVMEFVPGSNLRQVMRDRGRLSPAEAVAVMDHVLSALATAHAAGLVHRDVKPENVLVTVDGRVKVADFGLARAVAGTTVTTTGSVLLGTAAYLAPEQFEHGHADARSDVYSAGILFFELLTGRPPFQADSAYALLKQHANQDIPAPSSQVSGIPPQLDALVTWAASRDPRQRPADAGELHASLLDVRDRLGLHGAVPAMPMTSTTRVLTPNGARPNDLTRPVPSGRPTSPGRPPKRPAVATAPRRRRRRGLIATALVAVIAVLAAVLGWWLADGRYTHAPNVLRLTRSAAEAKLKSAGLHYRWLSSVHSATIASGLVAGESPSGRIEHGGTVSLQLSSGPVQHQLPSVRGESVSEATAALNALQIKVSGIEHHFSSVPKGNVVGTHPPSGKTVDAGSSVTLIVSKGQQMVQVPPDTNMSAADARNALKDAGFQINATQAYSSTVQKGWIISSDPTAGTSAVKGSTVTIVISRGPKLFPVPDVDGDSISDAVKAIHQAGFNPDPRQVLPGGPGRVLRYSPSSPQAKGTTIVLYYF